MRNVWFVLLGILIITTACEKKGDKDSVKDKIQGRAQAVSLLGEPLFAGTPAEKSLEHLKQARKDYLSDPNDTDNIVWYGRRAAYTGDYRNAVRIYTEGISKFAGDARFYRHRGHRYISLREFDNAINDFQKAVSLIEGKEDMIEPDGLPNAQNIPLSTLHTNIWYHLGLAYYLKNDLDNALKAYQEGIEASKNDDMLVAMLHWHYMSLRLLERDEEAAQSIEPVHKDMNIIENMAYHKLCLLYKGDVSVEEIAGEDFSNIMNDALAYGIGNWYFYNERKEEAREVFESILANKVWASFGHIAAEAQLAREF